jgi:hypothetical protein
MSLLFVVLQAEPIVLELVEYNVHGAHYDWHTDDHAISLSVQLSNSDAYEGCLCPMPHSILIPRSSTLWVAKQVVI